MAIFLVSVII